MKKTKSTELTFKQTEIAGRFNDLSLKNPKMTFEQVSLKALGKKLFGKTLNAKQFEKECRRVFDKEREG